jgi:hypothetical protein
MSVSKKRMRLNTMDTNNNRFSNRLDRSPDHRARRQPCRAENNVGLRMACEIARRTRDRFHVLGLSARA